MPGRKVFYTAGAPEPLGPYSQAVVHNGLLYISGQIPVSPETGETIKGTIEEETEATLNNIRIIVEEAGAGLKDILKVTCYLTEMQDAAGFNKVYKRFFKQDQPARSTVFVKGLPLNVRVEIDAIVALRQ